MVLASNRGPLRLGQCHLGNFGTRSTKRYWSAIGLPGIGFRNVSLAVRSYRQAVSSGLPAKPSCEESDKNNSAVCLQMAMRCPGRSVCQREMRGLRGQMELSLVARRVGAQSG